MLPATYTSATVICAVTDLTRTVNTVANIAALVILVLGAITAILYGPRALKGREALAQAEQKDRIIANYKEERESLKGRVESLETDVRELRVTAQEAQSQAKEWHARYDEQSKYTAEPALLEVRDSIRAMESTTATALTALGELVMKSNELLANLQGSFGFREGDRPQ